MLLQTQANRDRGFGLQLGHHRHGLHWDTTLHDLRGPQPLHTLIGMIVFEKNITTNHGELL